MLEKGIIGLVLGGMAALSAFYPLIWLYLLGYAFVKGERFYAQIVDVEERPADRVACYAPVVKFERNGHSMRMPAEPLIVLLPFFAMRRVRRRLLLWQKRNVTVLYARPFPKREPYVCIVDWIWKDIPVIALLVLLTAVALAGILNL